VGSSERRSPLDPLIRNVTGSLGWFICVITYLSACQVIPTILPSQTQVVPSATQIPTATPIPSATSVPTATVTPTISPTPGPAIVLEDTHSKISYIIPITVQHITRESMICAFELDRPVEGYLFYWPTGEGTGERRWLPLSNEVRQHVIEIGGLVPGMEYHLAVGLLDESGSYLTPGFLGAAWDPIRVRTLDQEKWPLLVGALGDSGFGETITYELAEQMVNYDLDFVLHTGDIVYNVSDNENVQEAFAIKYFQTLSPVLKRFPIYPVPGNHEYYADAFFEDKPYYFHVFPPFVDTWSGDSEEPAFRKWYTIELSPIQILMLDSQLFWRGEGRSEQTTWLAERLKDDRFQISIPIMHVPPFTSGIYPNDGKVVRVDWVPLFESGRVPLVLSGHDHNYQRLRQNEITYVVTGGGSSVLYPMGTLLEQSQTFARRTHFVLLEFQPEYVKLSAITPTGEILDQAAIEYPN
jgi:3',5'-cyclic AMP phosphodiesterase CpdA